VARAEPRDDLGGDEARDADDGLALLDRAVVAHDAHRRGPRLTLRFAGRETPREAARHPAESAPRTREFTRGALAARAAERAGGEIRRPLAAREIALRESALRESALRESSLWKAALRKAARALASALCRRAAREALS